MLGRASCKVLGDERRAEWFDWLRMVESDLGAGVNRSRLGQLGAVAAMKAKVVARHDAAIATAAFRAWLHDGPAAGLGRQHRFTRTSTGWIPSSLLPSAGGGGSDGLDGMGAGEGCNDAMIDDGEVVLDDLGWSHSTTPTEDLAAYPPSGSIRPASVQEQAEQQALQRGAEWLCDAESYALPWPADLGESLPALDSVRLEGALRSFAGSTGLGCDKMHPKAWLRLGNGPLQALLHLLGLVEQLGRRPRAIGHVIIVLLAKPAGGCRPIGLFPSIVRI